MDRRKRIPSILCCTLLLLGIVRTAGAFYVDPKKNSPMTPWRISPLRNSWTKRLETLLSDCLLDREAYDFNTL